MKRVTAHSFLRLALAITLATVPPAFAGFEGYYEIPWSPWFPGPLYHPPAVLGNWLLEGTSSNSELQRSPSSPTFPAQSITLSHFDTAGEVTFHILAADSGWVFFDWMMNNRPGSECGFLSNGVYYALAPLANPGLHLGSFQSPVVVGDDIGWYVRKVFGTYPATVQIQNFSAPDLAPPDPSPAQLAIAPVRSGDNLTGIRITVSGFNGQSAVLQSSPDLSQWTDLVTNTVSTGPWTFDYTDPLNGRRFYRVVVR